MSPEQQLKVRCTSCGFQTESTGITCPVCEERTLEPEHGLPPTKTKREFRMSVEEADEAIQQGRLSRREQIDTAKQAFAEGKGAEYLMGDYPEVRLKERIGEEPTPTRNAIPDAVTRNETQPNADTTQPIASTPEETFVDRPTVVIAAVVDYHCPRCDGPCKLPPGSVHVDYVDGKAIADMRRYQR